jgi:hypothetical protein
MTYEYIGLQLGLTTSGAYQCVRRAMESLVAEPAKELVQITYERLNQMLLVLWPAVNAGDIRAISEARALMNDMLRIMGADNPTKIQVDQNVTGEIGMIHVDITEADFIAEMQKVIFQSQYQNEHLALNPPEPEIVFGGGDDGSYDDEEDIIEAVVIEEEPTRPEKPRSMAVTPKE